MLPFRMRPNLGFDRVPRVISKQNPGYLVIPNRRPACTGSALQLWLAPFVAGIHGIVRRNRGQPDA